MLKDDIWDWKTFFHMSTQACLVWLFQVFSNSAVWRCGDSREPSPVPSDTVSPDSRVGWQTMKVRWIYSSSVAEMGLS